MLILIKWLSARKEVFINFLLVQKTFEEKVFFENYLFQALFCGVKKKLKRRTFLTLQYLKTKNYKERKCFQGLGMSLDG